MIDYHDARRVVVIEPFDFPALFKWRATIDAKWIVVNLIESKFI